MTFKQQIADRLGPQAVKALQKRGFDAYYYTNSEQAIRQAMALVPMQDLLSWGGSATLDESGIKAALIERGNSVIDRDKAKTPDEKAAFTRQALLCDTFLMSANAISADGQLVNIDGNGNRVAAMCFGPHKVIVVAGANKIAEDEAAALARIHTEASPANCIRLGKKTPCAVTGICGKCLTPGQTICSYTVTTRFSCVADRIHVILVNEDLGF